MMMLYPPRDRGRQIGAIGLSGFWGRVVVCLCLALAGAVSVGRAQLSTLEQASNGTPEVPVSAVDWVSSTITVQRGHYVEGSSIPYRLVVGPLLLGAHRVVIAWDTKIDGRHTIDFLTHYNRLTPHNQFGTHIVPETIQPLRNTSGGFQGPASFSIPPPSTQPGSSANLGPGQRDFHIYNGTITSASYVFEGSMAQPGAESRMAIDFTANDTTVVILFGGHLATKVDWGAGQTASGIIGQEYRMRVIELDGLPSLLNVAVDAQAVVAPPTCNITGPDTPCPGTTNIYTATTDVGGANSAWTLTANSAGASIVGPSTGAAVQVHSGSGGGTYALQVAIAAGPQQTACAQVVRVLTNVTTTALANVSVCAGGAATFVTQPSGPGPFAFRWRREGQVIEGQTSKQLTLSNVTSAVRGLYCVEVSGACGAATSCATLTVFSNTTATPLANLARCVGEGAVFSTTTSGAGPFTYRWLKNGVQIADQTNRILLTGTLALSDAGTYTVEVTGLCSSVTNSATLTVYGLPPCNVQGPTIVCPGSSANVFTAPANFAAYSWRITGNGVIIGPTNQAAVTVGGTSAGFATLQLTVINSNGCSRSCSRAMTIGDSQAPTITCPANVQTNTAPGQCSRAVAFSVPASDDCGAATVTCIPPSGTEFQKGATTVNCTAVDGANNRASCSFAVTVSDFEKPMLVWPTNLVVNTSLGTCETPVNYGVTVSDNCPGTTLTCTPPSGTVFPLGTSGVSCRGTDASGNFESCAFNVTVMDAEGPQVSCPGDLTFSADDGQCDVLVEYQAQATDNCALANLVCVPASGSLFSLGITTVICTATDVSHNVSRCSFQVQVDDGEKPRLVCPGDISVFAEPGRCDSIVQYFYKSGDNCRDLTVVCVPPSGAHFPVGQTNVVCTATDSSGNVSACSFKVTVTDNQRPVLTCPEDLTVNMDPGGCSAVVQYTNSVADNCPGVKAQCVPPPGSVFSAGMTVVNCFATDASSNAVSCAFNVTVQDAELPKLICPVAITTNTGPGECSAAVTFDTLGTDNCSGVQVLCDPQSGSRFPVGETVVFCLALDASGNVELCMFPVRVSDAERPVISCPTDITLNTAPGRCDAVATFNPTATDNCGSVPVPCVPPAGSVFPKGTNVVNCSARDTGGNQSTCAFRLVVYDREAPAIACPDNVITNAAPDGCDTFVMFSPSVSDNCGSAGVVCLPASGSRFVVGETPVTCIATDAAGNTNQCRFSVIVRDQQQPQITCPQDVLAFTGPATCDAEVMFTASASDNCPGVTIQCVPPSGSRFALGRTVVACTATDAGGNVAACAFTVTVKDNQPPLITCPPNVVTNTAADHCDAVVSYGATVSDNCSGATIVCTPASGSTFPLGLTAVNCVATDAGGNTNRCSFTVSVEDRQKPIITCPPSQIYFTSAGHCDAVATFAASASDNCGAAIITCEPTSGSRFAKGTNYVTCTARDAAGNTESCSFTVTVRDTEPPVLTCSTNMLVPMDPGRCDALLTFAPIVADECGGPTVICVPPSGARFPNGTTPVNCTATDSSSNRVTCVFTVQVLDREEPVMSCPSEVVTNTAPVRCDAVVSFEFSVADNCGGSSAFCDPSSGSAFPVGTTSVLCIGTDLAGNQGYCVFSVIVSDTEKPSITCPPSISVNTESGRCDALVTFTASATDNCSQTIICVPPSGSRFTKGAHTVNCTATDPSGNSGSCSFSVTVRDSELPVVSCPTNMTLHVQPERCSVRANFSAQVSDNCPGAAIECFPPSDSEFPIGTTTVVCHAIDAAGNTRLCAFDVTVVDTEPPRLVCPGDLTVDTEPTQCSATVSYSVSAGDSCSLTNLACVPPSGSVFQKGLTAVRCSARDASGNEATCTFNVTVRDGEPPTLLCPTNLVMVARNGRCDAPVEFGLWYSDNCPGATLVCVPPSGSTFTVGSTLVNCTASDAGGNTNRCSFTVRVTDAQRPILTCSSNLVVDAETNRCDAIVTFATSVTDNCGPTTITCSPASGSRFALGSTPVTCSSADSAGNVGTCSFTVTVRDNQKPILQCPKNVTVSAGAGRCDALVTFTVAAADNCGAVSASCFPPSGSVFPLGTTAVACSAADGYANVSTCQFLVTVQDLEPPELQCPSDIFANTLTGRCDTVVSFAAQSSDNCSSADVGCVPPSGSNFLKGTNWVTCTARDASSNSVACSFRVIVRDNEKPQIACPGDRVVSAEPGQCRARVSYSATVLDNCPDATVVCNPVSNSYFNKGVTTVICTATDASGNTNRCSFSVTVIDTESPTIACPANIVTNSAPGQNAAVVQFTAVVADNCSGASYVCTPQSGSIFHQGITPVTCVATDSAGNTNRCAFTVTVNDTEPPVINCPTNLIFAATLGRCDAVCNYAVTASDNSQVVTVICVPPSGSTFPAGVTNIQCTASDPSSNRVSCTFSITIADLEKPVIICPTNMTVGTEHGRCDARVSYSAQATDNCGAVSLVCAPPSGAIFPKGTNTVTCTATDSSGNTERCVFYVRVLDNEAPSLTCASNMVIILPPGQCDVSASFITPVTDNCPGSTVSCVPPPGSILGKGLMTVNCTARDSSGNTSTCSFPIDVRDQEGPMITCPADINLPNYPGSCGAPVGYSATVRDNCPGATLSCTPVNGTVLPVGTNVVTCNAVDTSGNTSSCSFRVVIRDLDRPALNCPGDIVLDGSNGTCAPIATYNPPVSDNCPGVTLVCMPPSGSTFPQGTNRVTCTAFDASSNMSYCAFSVIVRLQPLTATPLQSQTRCAGETATFTTAASGSGPVTFMWLKNGAVLPNQASSTLLVSNLTAANGGTYSVVVQNPCSRVTNSAVLQVNTPVAISGMTNITLCNCDPLVLSPLVSGTGPLTFMWRKNGVVLPGATGNNLAFSKLTTNDVGTYTVEVSGACNTAVASATIGVITVPNPAVYTNSGTIAIRDRAPAFPYPSSVHVVCVPQTVKRATVTLRGFTHAYPDDVDVLLAAPDGKSVMLMSDAGDGNFANNVTLNFDDSAALPVPDSAQLVTGTFRPGNYDTDSDAFAVPAPKLTPANTLSTLAGTDPNGFWSLFVMDDFQLDGGSINNGWILRLYWESSPVVLSAPRVLTSGAFQMTMTGDAGATYAIEASADLLTWRQIGIITLSSSQADFTDASPPKACFYRAVQR